MASTSQKQRAAARAALPFPAATSSTPLPSRMSTDSQSSSAIGRIREWYGVRKYHPSYIVHAATSRDPG